MEPRMCHVDVTQTNKNGDTIFNSTWINMCPKLDDKRKYIKKKV